MSAVDKYGVSRALSEIANYLEISDSNPFKSMAYRKASRAVDALTMPVEDLVAKGTEIPGIGKGIRPIFVELVETGSSPYLEELRAQYPPGIFQLNKIPGLGLKKIGVIFEKLGIGTLDALEEGCRTGAIGKLPGFGAKTQQKILEGIEFVRSHSSEVLLPIALAASHVLRERIAEIDCVEEVIESGAVRRKLEVVDRVVLVVVTNDPEALFEECRNGAVIDRFEVRDGVATGMTRGDLAVELHATPSALLGVTLLATTGNEPFASKFLELATKSGIAIEGDSVTVDGKKKKVDTEEDLFKLAKVPYVEPELRESAELLRSKKRPALVTREDLRGTFHVHTTYSDGKNTLEEMLTAAKDLGFEYVGISDHSQTAGYAGGLTEARLAEQKGELEKLRPRFKDMRIFRGSEADILEDGTIDYGPRILDQFDFVVASVHSRFKMERDKMTERMVRALHDPHVTFLGHLTGRLLLSREGYDLDFDAVFEAAAKNGVIIEINGSPRRLDIDWRRMQRAAELGVGFSIHPDAHSIDEYRHLMTGVWHARKGGIAPEQIFNTRPIAEIGEHLAARRKRVAAGS